MRRGSVTGAVTVARPLRRRVRPATVALFLALALLPPGAVAHGGTGGSESQQHLVTDVFGVLAFAFVAYIAVAFARRVVYPKLRDALSG